MATYTEGVCDDGACILKNGTRMTITEVIQELELAARKNSLPEYHINQTWICECGAKHTRYTLTPEWRWTGTVWEHYHGYPIGHVQTHPEK